MIHKNSVFVKDIRLFFTFVKASLIWLWTPWMSEDDGGNPSGCVLLLAGQVAALLILRVVFGEGFPNPFLIVLGLIAFRIVAGLCIRWIHNDRGEDPLIKSEPLVQTRDAFKTPDTLEKWEE